MPLSELRLTEQTILVELATVTCWALLIATSAALDTVLLTTVVPETPAASWSVAVGVKVHALPEPVTLLAVNKSV